MSQTSKSSASMAFAARPLAPEEPSASGGETHEHYDEDKNDQGSGEGCKDACCKSTIEDGCHDNSCDIAQKKACVADADHGPGCCRGDQPCFAKQGFDDGPCCPPGEECCGQPGLGNIISGEDLEEPLLSASSADQGLSTCDIYLQRLCCNGEALMAQRTVLPLGGVRHVRVDVSAKLMTVKYNPQTISPSTIAACLRGKSLRPKIIPAGQTAADVSARATVTSTFAISKLCCASETQTIVKVLEPVEGIEAIRPNVVLKKLVVKHDPSRVSSALICKLLSGEGLGAEILRDGGASVNRDQDADVTASRARAMQLSVKSLNSDADGREIKRMLASLPGVKQVEVNLMDKEVKISAELPITSAEEVCKWLQERGIEATIASLSPVQQPMRVVSRSTYGSIVVPITGSLPEMEHEKPTLYTRMKTLSGYLPHWNVLLALVCWIVSLCHYAPNLEMIKFVGLGSVALCLPPIAIAAVKRLRYGVLDINMLMALAVVGAIAIGDYPEAAAVVTLFSLSEWLQYLASSRVRVAMNALLELAPEVALLAEPIAGVGSVGEQVGVEAVPVGARLGIRAGDKFPMDGRLVAGAAETHANESNLTGESRPVRKGPGDEVSAGTINLDTYVEMIVSREHEDSTVARMVRLVEEAASARAPMQQLIEKIARIYTPITFVVAILLATVPWAVSHEEGRKYLKIALVFLVVACPCALVISTPMAYVCGLAQAAQEGILVRGGAHLETLGRLKTMAMDKTGTLTQGKFEVLDVVVENSGPFSQAKTLALVREAEAQSSHPIALALLRTAASSKSQGGDTSLPWRLVQTDLLPGQGLSARFEAVDAAPEAAQALTLLVGNRALAAARAWPSKSEDLAAGFAEAEARGHTAVWVGTEEDGPIAFISLGDKVRPESKGAVAALHQRGVEVVMLTGDNEGAARAISEDLGVDKYFAGLRPEDKVARLHALAGIKGMVGDGVNDAPSLAAADVSVSLGCIGTAVALETADVALMQDDLNSLVAAVDLGRKCFRIIVQNVTFSILLKLGVLCITLTVYSRLWLAIVADVGGMLLVTLNAMSIISRKSTLAQRKAAQVSPLPSLN
ncbi:Cadmium/zinc-transporting ATPase HMA2 [Hondaea fermentalgiana]|uniref:Cadmium/zinc-transporting ATPase HMA2 n=1 Tax=Hondaea fermentalgiana TaxID=2315210 RepID=A0A2R5G7S1_9STRA|nr:Cadmium/zinc-transporting ATPase HMA2 [Hondaea fermentalgiana]|eukprot:GBG25848.1 Cadmium/zinc-transporting ATPase HMA2 [Hondaea fermentalgiana]